VARHKDIDHNYSVALISAMVAAFRQYLQSKGTFSDKEMEFIDSLARKRTVKKKQFILRADEVCRYHTFICKGCMKLYRLGETGEEHIIKFAVEDWWISDRQSLLSGEPSDSYIVALEDTDVLHWTNAEFEQLQREIPAFDAMFRRLVSKALDASQQRVFSNISFTAEEKYNTFLTKYPGLIGRVPLHMIAAYLGVTRETLTRLRSHRPA